MTRAYGSKAMTQKHGRLAFQMLVMNCTDDALTKLTAQECAASYAGVRVDEANSVLLAERLRRSA